mmetsp:Transcript_7843/g.13098  ORF Transcript_7843/g.13098 Transcript_7843/m.13098 type:complete len:114 (+) Transcript_7843:730-1071(+)
MPPPSYPPWLARHRRPGRVWRKRRGVSWLLQPTMIMHYYDGQDAADDDLVICGQWHHPSMVDTGSCFTCVILISKTCKKYETIPMLNYIIQQKKYMFSATDGLLSNICRKVII